MCLQPQLLTCSLKLTRACGAPNFGCHKNERTGFMKSLRPNPKTGKAKQKVNQFQKAGLFFSNGPAPNFSEKGQKMSNTTQPLVIVSRDELAAIIIDSMHAVLRTHQPQKEEPQGEVLPELLTRRDVARYFQISIATVDNLTKAGVLEKHYLAGQPRFKRDEVRKALEGWKKYQRG